MHASLVCGEWTPIGCLNQNVQLSIGDSVHVTFYDMQGELVDLSFSYKVTALDQGEPSVWPRLIAEYINVHIPLVSAGRMTDDGIIVAYRDNQVFTLESSGITTAKVEFSCSHKAQSLVVSNTLEYDYIYPAGGASYNAGDKVLHPHSGHIFQCKPWPFSELCRVTNEQSAMFEPGVGKSWSMAWQKIV
jgi:hypothetical protein